MRYMSWRNRLSKLLFAWFLLSHTAAFTSVAAEQERREASTHEYDVVIYGNTVAALAAAIQTIRMGKTAAVVCARNTLGGLTTSGLGWTDSKNGTIIGGIAREFYEKVYEQYQEGGLWDEETRATYLAKRVKAQPGPAIDERRHLQWTFEPKVAEAIWEDWMRQEGISVFRNSSIKRSKDGVTKEGATITSMISEDGTVFKGKMFIDASYEGDLLEVSGIPYSIGRESRDEYGESKAGVLIDIGDQYQNLKIDPYVKEGDPESGLLTGITRVMGDPKTVDGEADPLRLQAYNYRLCLTKEENNQVPFYKPDNYKEETFEILFRHIESGYTGKFFTTSPMPNYKTDTNSQGQVSTDLLGGNFDKDSNYPEWSYDKRKKAEQRHKDWTQGLLWTLAKHPRVPKTIRKNVAKWGYAKDEFVSNDNWPYEIYIREGRRMNGQYVMKQKDVQSPGTFPDDSVIAMSSYTFDVHRVERVVYNDEAYNEGFVHVANKAPFPIPFNAIVPNPSDSVNFLNPVTLSSTHIAFAAIRMEPTYMILGQSAATAAVLAIEQGVNIQDVDRSKLTKKLRADAQVVEGSSSKALPEIYGLYIAIWFVYVIITYT